MLVSNEGHQADDVLVRVHDLRVSYPMRGPGLAARGRRVPAVDGISFTIRRGRTLGLVGESGCGKTTTAKAMLGLAPAASGSVRLGGVDVLGLRGASLRAFRRRLQMVFQDPARSLNPRRTVGDTVGEGLVIHRLARGTVLRDRVHRLLEQVGLQAADGARYPHALSAGQRQRVAIARALTLEPELLICDEPVSALDVSVQGQILNLLMDLQRDLGLTYLFISHDLAVVRHVSTDVAVMYMGRIVETAEAEVLFEHPAHPYTRTLLWAILDRSPIRARPAAPPVGEAPSRREPPSGCPFHPRCPQATDECRRLAPPLESAPGSEGRHRVACHHAATAEPDRS
jgi:oligopeptide/dipeptide ABC transporter ATP-binding protein